PRAPSSRRALIRNWRFPDRAALPTALRWLFHWRRNTVLLEEFIRAGLGGQVFSDNIVIERVAYAGGRSVHRVGPNVFVKAYPADDFAAFEVEKSVATAFRERPGSPAPPLLAQARTEQTAFLAFGRADGVV